MSFKMKGWSGWSPLKKEKKSSVGNILSSFRGSDWNFDLAESKLPGMGYLERTGYSLLDLAKKKKIQKYQQAQVQKYHHAMKTLKNIRKK